MKFNKLQHVCLLLISLSIFLNCQDNNNLNKKKNQIGNKLKKLENPNRSKTQIKNKNKFSSGYNRHTTLKNWDNDTLVNLELHDVGCNDDQALQGFELVRIDNSGSYNYRCINDLAIQKDILQTNTQKVKVLGNNWATALSSIGVNCSNGYVLQELRLNYDKNQELSYNFKCIKAFVEQCVEATTQENPITKLDSLLNLPIITSENQAISSFRLNYSNSTSSVSYKYSVCDLTDMVAKAQKEEAEALQAKDDKAAQVNNNKAVLDEKKSISIQAQKNYNNTLQEVFLAQQTYDNSTQELQKISIKANNKHEEVILRQKKEEEFKKLSNGFFNQISNLFITFVLGIILV